MALSLKLSTKEKIGLGLAIAVALLALFDRVMIGPLNARFHQLNQEIRLAELDLCRDLRNLDAKDAITKEFQDYAKYAKQMGSDEEEMARFLREIENLAHKSSVNLLDVKPQMPKSKDLQKQFIVEVEAEGDLPAIVMFLHQLNTSECLLRAEKITLKLIQKEKSLLRASILVTKMVIS
jgi:Tfp pilus assembly protein PilO